MSEKRSDGKSRQGRFLRSDDSQDDNVVNKRRKLHQEDKKEGETGECGVKPFGEGEEEEERHELEVDSPGDGEEEEEERSCQVESGNGEGFKSKPLLKIDRLSALPDPLLISIISFLNPRERAMTSVLSKRWKYVWIECPSLMFSNESGKARDVRKYMAWVRRTLAICSGNHLEEFDVCLNYKRSYASDVNACVQFAFKNKVKRFSLLFNRWMCKSCKDSYMLPQVVFSSSSLHTLQLQGCTMSPQRGIDWGSLTELTLVHVGLHEHVIDKILSGCPVLRKLNLWKCPGLDSFEVSSRKLDELLIFDCDDGNGKPLLQISAPYLGTLRVLMNIEGRLMRFMNISPLVKVDIEFMGVASDAISMKVMNYTDELFENLEHVKNLEVGHAFVQVLSKLAVNGWQLSESHREYLEIQTSADEDCRPGIICLLNSSPLLQKLIIDGRHPWDCGSHENLFPDGLDASRIRKVYLRRELLHLKKVFLTRFANPDLGGQPMLTFVQLLLDRAKVLETIGIDFGEVRFTPSEYIKITGDLLCFWRSSPKAMVIIKEGDLIRDETTPIACCSIPKRLLFVIF